MTIDITKPVRLTRHVHHQGNFYHPRVYQPGELPIEIINDSVCVNLESSPVAAFTPAPGMFEATEINVSVETPVSAATSYPNTTPALIVKPKVQINKASVDELSQLEKVGSATAMKIVEERGTKPFTSIEDLTARVPLPKNGKWESLKDQLFFD